MTATRTKIKKSQLELLERFRDMCENIAASTSLVPNETAAEKQARMVLLRKDYNACVKYYFPHYAKADCGWFHLKAAKKIKASKKAKLLLKWARAHAKSTHADIMIPFWLFIQEPKEIRFMVLVGKNLESAQRLLSDIQAEFASNERIIADFGQQVSHGSWEKGSFVTRAGVAFFALGRGQSPRGLRFRNYRPDYIAFDDIDDEELCRNPKRVGQVYKWALKAVIGASDMGNCRIVVANNKIAKESVLSHFEENSSFETIQVNALDKNGNPEWKEKYTKADIEDMVKLIGTIAASGELFNDPIEEGKVFKDKWVQHRNSPRLKDYDAIVSYCDPSFKNTDTSDYKAILTVGKTDGGFDIIDIFCRKCSVKEMVDYWYDFQDQLPDNIVVDYYMEANFIQDLIMDEFATEGIDRGWQLPLRKDKRKKPDKHARIEAMSPLWERLLFYIDNDIKDKEDTKVFLSQLLAFEKGNSGHDDGPDALEGAVYILNRMVKRSNSRTPMRSGKFQKNSKRGM